VSFVHADAAALPLSGAADAIFSTATFHWVLDHPRLFRSLFHAMRPGGRLVAQCGGGPNLHHVHEQCASIMQEPGFAPYFATWTSPWEFADAVTTRARLENAGFTDIVTSVEPAPVVFDDAASFREFVESVICHPHLARLPEQTLRDAFLDRLTAIAADDSQPFHLDYWRLNLDARRPD
jgi:trans-aconitate 2-methyltransferase